MSRIVRFLKLTWAIYFLICFVILFLLLYPFFLIFLSRIQWYPMAHKLRAIWGRMLMFLTGIVPKVEFEQTLDKKGTYIFAPNHFSYLDILSVNVLIPVYFNFMAKHSLNKIPLFNIFFRTIDIPVDRASNKSSHRAFTEAGKRLQQGTSLLLFPEGKIGSTVPQMSHFKLGAFRLAIENGVPIVPVTILDNYERMPDDGITAGGSPGRMRIYVHKPVPVDGLTVPDARRLAEKVFDIINQKLKEVTSDH